MSSLLSFLLLLPLLATSLKLKPSQYPSKIHLKAGVIPSNPMAIIEQVDSDEVTFRGFQIDLLESLKILAFQDGVDLQVDLSPSPTYLYNDAFDLIANDCNTTDNPKPEEDCAKFDMIVADYYSNADRHMRSTFTPSWLRSTMTTLKCNEKPTGSQDYTTLREAEDAQATVCVPQGTYLEKVVRQKFPRNNYISCDPSKSECIDLLKSGDCVLFAEDELLLHYKAMHDPSLEVTRESFNTQYMAWPMREDLPTPVTKLMKKWMYDAVQNATLDELFFKYFKRELCPHGTAGLKCELPCDPDNGRADAHGKCVCKSTKWTGDDCSIEVPEELNMLPTTLVHACYSMAGINFALVACCAVWLFRNRHRSQVRIAQPVFLMLILVGCVISSSTIFAMAQEDEGDGPVYSCAAIPWLYSIGFCMTFGALFAKIRRLHILLQSAIQMKRVTISVRETLMSVALVLAIDVTILTVWTIVDPLEWSRTVTSTDLFGEPMESQGYCDSEHWKTFAGLIASFHFLLLSVACYMCYVTRTIPEGISSGKYTAFAMFSNFQIFIIVIPVLIMLGSAQPQASFFIRSGAIWINDLVVVSLIFGDLIYRVYQHDAEAADDRSMIPSECKIKSDIRTYAESMRGSNRTSTCRLSNHGQVPQANQLNGGWTAAAPCNGGPQNPASIVSGIEEVSEHLVPCPLMDEQTADTTTEALPDAHTGEEAEWENEPLEPQIEEDNDLESGVQRRLDEQEQDVERGEVERQSRRRSKRLSAMSLCSGCGPGSDSETSLVLDYDT